MEALRQKSRGLPEAQEIEAMPVEGKRTAETRGPRRKVRTASRGRYEAHMQELAADSQQIVSTDVE